VTPAQDRRTLGASGEERVAAWYSARGFTIVGRNWRCRQGELDVIARAGGLIVFCEVKTRSSTAFGAPVEAVTPAKQRRLRVLGAKWLDATGQHADALRFDVASVIGDTIEVYQGVL
jgi:putative endonuclease